MHRDRRVRTLMFWRKLLFIASIICMLFLCIQCLTSPQPPSDVLVNPIDPLSPIYMLPVTTIVTPPASLDTNDFAVIVVKGNKDAIEFSYMLDANNWSAWSSSTTIYLTDLDEGAHRCTIRALHRDLETIEQNPPSVDFTVHSITGPALMFSTRKLEVTSGASFNYYIVAYQVQNLYGANIVFSYDATAITINSISSGSIANVDVQLLQMQYANEAKMDVFFTNAGSINGITGSDSIIVLNCTALKPGTDSLVFVADSIEFRNASNVPITINRIVNGKVVAQ